MPNWYATRDAVKRAVRLHGNENDEAVDRLIEAASRDVDHLTHRRFIPETATKLIRWPSRMGYGSVLWLEADLISITTLQSEAQNSSPTTIASTDYFLEPQQTGPPFNRIEIDISSTAAFASGDTPQRSISIAGSWGYQADTDSVGTVDDSGGISSSDTALICDNGSVISGIAVGDTLLIDSEQLFVTEKTSAALASIVLDGALTASKSENVTVDGGTHGINVGEVVQVDSEQMFVRATTSTVLTVERAYNGTTLAAHNDGVAVHIFRTLTVTRAVNGTTAASHADTTAITAYRAPGPIRQLVTELAIVAVTQEAASWTRTIGAGEGTQAMSSTGLDALMDRVVSQYVRPREAAL